MQQTHLKVSRASTAAAPPALAVSVNRPRPHCGRSAGKLRTSTRTPTYVPNVHSGPRSLLPRVTAFSQGLPRPPVWPPRVLPHVRRRLPSAPGPGLQAPPAATRSSSWRPRRSPPATRDRAHQPAPTAAPCSLTRPPLPHAAPGPRPPYARHHLGQEVVPPRPAALGASPRPSLRTCAPRGRPSLRKHFLWAP